MLRQGFSVIAGLAGLALAFAAPAAARMTERAALKK